MNQQITYLEAPYEDEQEIYIKSFDIKDDKGQIKDFFDQYGFVAIRDVVSKNECELSKQEIWQDLQDNSLEDIYQEDIQSLVNVDKFVKRFGLIGSGYPVMLPQAVKNRQNPNIYESYRIATGNEYFLVARERYGFMRPTKYNPEWKTIEKWLHIDYNPYTGLTSFYGYQQTQQGELTKMQKQKIPWQHAYFQGIIALDDCPVETGGFHIVPGFHRNINEWVEQNKQHCIDSSKSSDPSTVQIPQNDICRNYIQKIPIRQGTLLIWDGRSAHANFPNTGEKPRYVQYIKMNAIGENIISQIKTRTDTNEELEASKVELTELGQKLYGIKKWYEKQDEQLI